MSDYSWAAQFTTMQTPPNSNDIPRLWDTHMSNLRYRFLSEATYRSGTFLLQFVLLAFALGLFFGFINLRAVVLCSVAFACAVAQVWFLSAHLSGGKMAMVLVLNMCLWCTAILMRQWRNYELFICVDGYAMLYFHHTRELYLSTRSMLKIFCSQSEYTQALMDRGN